MTTPYETEVKFYAPDLAAIQQRLEAGGAICTAPRILERNVRYETIIVDGVFQRFQIRFFKFWDALFVHFQNGGSISRSAISLAHEKRTRPFTNKVMVAEEQYVVAFQADNRVYESAATFSSYAEAEAHMAQVIRLKPALSEEVHIIPSVEVNRAA